MSLTYRSASVSHEIHRERIHQIEDILDQNGRTLLWTVFSWRSKAILNIINLLSSLLSVTIAQGRQFKMFLKNHFFFFRFYFKIMDPLKCIIFTWNPKLEYFEMSRSLSIKRISYALIVFQFLYSFAATYVFLAMKIKGLSTISLAFHLVILACNWYLLLFRCFYTTKANELVGLMNIAILLEKRHLHSKFDHWLNVVNFIL